MSNMNASRTPREIHRDDDVIDSRDVIARVAWLEQEIEDEREDGDAVGVDRVEELTEELEALQKLAEECEGFSEWEHGLTLIHESHFTDYCEELVKDIGDLPQNVPFYIVIDWEATANNLRHDYSAVDFGGETYYVRD